MPLFNEDALAETFYHYRRLLECAVIDDTPEIIIGDIVSLIRRWETGSFVWDDGGAYFEDLTGTAFIVLQTKITRVASAARELNNSLTNFGIQIPGYAKQSKILSLGNNYKDTGSTLVQLIWDVANYFKHRDERGRRYGSYIQHGGLQGISESNVQSGQ